MGSAMSFEDRKLRVWKEVLLGLGLVLTAINVSWLVIWVESRYRPDAESDLDVITGHMMVCFCKACMLSVLFGIMVGMVMTSVIVEILERHGWPHAELRPLYGATPTTAARSPEARHRAGPAA